ncbi:GNAT family N-acetyltransferase [Mariniflexile gromovii]|uniref:GNAT family N-acetyltransferase n=1 Tax=Mariniflexile gromovii TaxID=362523 RepID=A0ABS4BSQ6_9FLAO|nr:GNAT family N-acetyltransferase [Mariniflexile gromovii]MBP0903041.1 GNAT family N-acetyltransferase [Mariniflexile gromovii]
MSTILDIEIDHVIEQAETFCAEAGIEIKLVYKLSHKSLEIISERSRELPTLYFVSVDMLKKRVENGCFILKKEDQIIGHIFVHEHQVKGHFVYERSSLWVDNAYRNYNLGLLLMAKITEFYSDTFLISIAQTPKVHHYNELLGMTHVTLSKMSLVLVEELEKLGKLRDELNFKYYVNACFEAEIRELK